MLETHREQRREERHGAALPRLQVGAHPAPEQDRQGVLGHSSRRPLEVVRAVRFPVEVAVEQAGEPGAPRGDLVPHVAAPLLAREAHLRERPARGHAQERGGHHVVVVDAGRELAHGVELHHGVHVRGGVPPGVRLDPERVGEVLRDVDEDGPARARRAVARLGEGVAVQLGLAVPPVRPEVLGGGGSDDREEQRCGENVSHLVSVGIGRRRPGIQDSRTATAWRHIARRGHSPQRGRTRHTSLARRTT